MQAINLLVFTFATGWFVYRCLKHPGYIRDLSLCSWAVFNIGIIYFNIDSFPEEVRIFGKLSLGLMLILYRPIQRYQEAMKNNALFDNWDPGIPRWLIYLCPIITIPPALYAAILAKRFILMPDVPAPYSYVVMAGAGVLLLISLLAIFRRLPGQTEQPSAKHNSS